MPDSLRPGYASHSEVTAVAGLAAAAGAGRLVLAHLNPLHGEDYYAAMAETARGVFPACLVCDDGDSLDTAGVV